MKKMFYIVAVIALAFFAGSCQRENLEPVAANGTVTYTVEVPGAVATKSGVASDGVNNVNELVYEVYRIVKEEVVSGETVITLADDVLYRGTAPVSAGKATCKVDYINNQNHMVLFWAHQANNGLYNVGNLRNVTVNASVAGNTHANAAFTGKDILRNGVSDCFGSVTLTRPVAQLNIATTKQSLALENGRAVEVSESEVTVSGLSASFNVATGEVSGDAYVTYTSASANLGDLNDSYKLLSMNYVGFVPADGANVTVDYTLTTSEGEITNEISSVPVKRNIRTNIIGNLISNKSDYDVELDPDWGGADENVVVVSDAASLQDAINNATEGDEIKLEGDIDINDLLSLTKAVSTPSLNVPNGKNITLNLNGYNLTAEESSTGSYGLINNAGTLTIMNSAETGSTISLKATNDRNTNAYSSVISNQPGGNLTVLSNVTIQHLGGTYMAYGIDNLTNGGIGDVNATIDGATVKSTYRAVRQFLNSDSKENNLTVKTRSLLSAPNKGVFFQDPSAKANNGKLVIEDGANVGTVYLYVTEGSTEWPVNVSIAASAVEENGVTYKNVPAGYAVENVEGVWTVAFHPVAMIGEKGYGTLNAAFANVKAGETIILQSDVTIAETAVLAEGKTAVLDLNGKTLSHVEEATAYAINNHGTLTITGNGVVNSRGMYNGYDVNGNHVASAELTIENGTFNAKGTNGGAAVYNYGTVNINGGKFESLGGYALNNQSGAVMILKNASARGGIYVSGANLTIENSTVYQHISGRHAIYNWEGNVTIQSGAFDSESGNELILVDGTNASVILNGGTYNKTAKSWLLGAAKDKNITFVINGGIYNGYVNLPENTVDTIRPYGDPIVVKGGVFNFNPTQWIQKGYKAVEENGVWNVVIDPVAKIGTTEYAFLQDALNVGGEIVLVSDVELEQMVVLESGKTATLDLNGFNITVPEPVNEKSIYALNNKGTLTIKDTKGTGSISARGIYNGYNGVSSDGTVEGAKLTIENGAFYALDSNGGASVLNCAELIINGGLFDGQVAAVNGRKCANTTINGGIFRSVNNYTLQQNGGGVLTINNATVDRGFGAVGCYGGTVIIKDGTYQPTGKQANTCHVVYVAGAANVSILGGTFKMNYPENAVPDSGSAVASYYNGSLSISGGAFYAHFDTVSPVELSSGSTIAGGTFYNHSGVPSDHVYIRNYLAEGYVLENGVVK